MQPRAAIMCQAARIKMTYQRRVIADVVFAAGDHPDVEEIHRRVQAVDSKISLATVYRTINLFEANKIVKKLEIGDGKARYEVGFCDEHHHHHLIDVVSGEIIEFVDQELEELKERIAARLGYKLVDHRLELYGAKIKK